MSLLCDPQRCHYACRVDVGIRYADRVSVCGQLWLKLMFVCDCVYSYRYYLQAVQTTICHYCVADVPAFYVATSCALSQYILYYIIHPQCIYLKRL